MIFHKNNDTFLASLAIKNNLDMDKLLSGYLIMGEKWLLLMHVFEGCVLKIPSKRRLSSPSLYNIHYIEDDERVYGDYKRNDVLTYKDVDYIVVAEEKKVLNHWYLPVIHEEDNNEAADG